MRHLMITYFYEYTMGHTIAAFTCISRVTCVVELGQNTTDEVIGHIPISIFIANVSGLCYSTPNLH